jgi:hypothetical protein
MTDTKDTQQPIDQVAMPLWRWAYRLMRVVVMVILAFWMSRSGDAFFYQGF